MKELSIVIPTSGNIHNLNRLLLSIENYCTSYKLQTLVVCNPQNLYVNKFQENFKSISVKILQNRQVGVNKARQIGLENCIYKFVLFLDDDCELQKTSDLDALYNEVEDPKKDLFAVGGGYSFECNNLNFYAYNYAKNQMQWLEQGVVDIQKNESAYLIGGFFVLNKILCERNQIQFDANMIFGGTEKEFFLQAYKKKLKMRLLSVKIKHHYENKKIVFLKKIYKQGRGQKYIENKGLFFKPKYLTTNLYLNLSVNLDTNTGLQITLFDSVFWAGYFFYDREYLKYVKFILNKILNHMNEKKVTTLNKVKKNL